MKCGVSRVAFINQLRFRLWWNELSLWNFYFAHSHSIDFRRDEVEASDYDDFTVDIMARWTNRVKRIINKNLWSVRFSAEAPFSRLLDPCPSARDGSFFISSWLVFLPLAFLALMYYLWTWNNRCLILFRWHREMSAAIIQLLKQHNTLCCDVSNALRIYLSQIIRGPVWNSRFG